MAGAELRRKPPGLQGPHAGLGPSLVGELGREHGSSSWLTDSLRTLAADHRSRGPGRGDICFPLGQLFLSSGPGALTPGSPDLVWLELPALLLCCGQKVGRGSEGTVNRKQKHFPWDEPVMFL